MTAQGYPEEEHLKDPTAGGADLRKGTRPGAGCPFPCPTHSGPQGERTCPHLCGHSHTVSGFVFNSWL